MRAWDVRKKMGGEKIKNDRGKILSHEQKTVTKRRKADVTVTQIRHMKIHPSLPHREKTFVERPRRDEMRVGGLVHQTQPDGLQTKANASRWKFSWSHGT